MASTVNINVDIPAIIISSIIAALLDCFFMFFSDFFHCISSLTLFHHLTEEIISETQGHNGGNWYKINDFFHALNY